MWLLHSAAAPTANQMVNCVEAEGGTVYSWHDLSGALYTSVEVTPAQAADDGAIRVAQFVRRPGHNVWRGDVYAVRAEDAPGGGDRA